MPLAQIYLLEGRSEAQKATVIERVTDAIFEAVSAPRDAVRVLNVDMPRTNWGRRRRHSPSAISRTSWVSSTT